MHVAKAVAGMVMPRMIVTVRGVSRVVMIIMIMIVTAMAGRGSQAKPRW
jgi:hypothetical protein